MRNFADGDIENGMVLFDEEEDRSEADDFYDEFYEEVALEELR